MFTNKYLFFALGFSALVAGCKNEEMNDNYTDNSEELTATFGDKVSNNGLKTTLTTNGIVYNGSWYLNDTLLITDGTIASKYYTTTEGPVVAKLKRAEGQTRPNLEGGFIMAYYPGETASWNGEDGFDVKLPSTQVYNTNGLVSDDAYPMISKSTNTSLALYNLCSVFKFRAISELPRQISQIRLISSNVKMTGSGVAKFDGDEPSLVMSELAAGKKSRVVLSMSEPVDVDDRGRDFYIVVPPAIYTVDNTSIEVDVVGVGTVYFKLEFDVDLKRSTVNLYKGYIDQAIGLGTIGETGDNVD